MVLLPVSEIDGRSERALTRFVTIKHLHLMSENVGVPVKPL